MQQGRGARCTPGASPVHPPARSVDPARQPGCSALRYRLGLALPVETSDFFPPAVISLAVRNFSTVVHQRMNEAFHAFIEQVNDDLHYCWHHRLGLEKSWLPKGYHVPFLDEIVDLDGKPWPVDDKRSVWRATIYDYPAQALNDENFGSMPVDALKSIGYHFVDDRIPHMVVFAAISEQAGVPWTMTFSHELLEMVTDPYADTAIFDRDRYELEVCDPVQFQAYPIEGIWVSNFVLPEWFDSPTGPPGAESEGRFDFAGQLAGPRARSLGGTRSLELEGQELTETLTPMGSHTSRKS